MDKKQANQIPLAEVLRLVECSAVSMTDGSVTYQSPFDKKKEAVITVFPATNTWNDEMKGIGGRTVDLVCRYLRHKREDATPADALRWLTNMTAPTSVIKTALAEDNESFAYKLIRAEPLDDLALLRYLKKLGIDIDMARKHLLEVSLRNPENNDKVYALGFRNEEGGYAVLNSFLNGNVGAEGITFIRGHKAKPDGVHVFSNFIDYLTFLTIRKGRHDADVIVLNSNREVTGAFPYIKGYGYKTAYSWIANNTTGRGMTSRLAAFIKTEAGLRHRPVNGIYKPHETISAWHRHNLNLEQ